MDNKRRRIYLPGRKAGEPQSQEQEPKPKSIKVTVEEPEEIQEPSSVPPEDESPLPPEVETTRPSEEPEPEPAPAEPEVPGPAPSKPKHTLALPKIKVKARTIYVMGVILALILLGFVLWIFLKPKPPIPPAIRSQINFTIFYPSDGTVVKVQRDTIKYDTQAQLLSYIGLTNNGTKIIFSEQATPGTFTDILPAYSALLERLQGYSTFETPSGKVTLTHPKELHGAQSAVMNSKGTLMFAKPEKIVSDADLRRVFNNLVTLPQN